jgi:RimJ/RimL family protein N-acetyltransferase
MVDLLSLAEAISNPLFPINLPLSDKYRSGTLDAWLSNMVSSNIAGYPCLWPVFPAASKECIGQVSVLEHPLQYRVWLSYWVTPRRWGNGVATACVRAICEFILSVGDYTQVRAAVAYSNEASNRLLRSLGFVAGSAPGPAYCSNGRVYETTEYVLSKDSKEIRAREST